MDRCLILPPEVQNIYRQWAVDEFCISFVAGGKVGRKSTVMENGLKRHQKTYVA